jgi:hypothetical protein
MRAELALSLSLSQRARGSCRALGMPRYCSVKEEAVLCEDGLFFGLRSAPLLDEDVDRRAELGALGEDVVDIALFELLDQAGVDLLLVVEGDEGLL